MIEQVHREFTKQAHRDRGLCDKALFIIRKFTEDMTKNEVQKKNLNQKLDYFIIKTICHSVTSIEKIDNYRGTRDTNLLSQIGLKVSRSQYEVLKMCSKEEDLAEGDPVQITLQGNFHTTDRSICTTINTLQ